MALQGVTPIEWEPPVGRNPAIEAMLRSKPYIKVEPGAPPLAYGFNALRRAQLIRLLKEHGIAIKDEGVPKESLVRYATVAWDQGQFGPPERFLVLADDKTALKALLAERDAKIDALTARLGELTELVERSVSRETNVQSGRGEWSALKTRARDLGINTHKMKRADVIAAIEVRERELAETAQAAE